MSLFRESIYVAIVEFAIKLSIEGNALFSISDFKKQSNLSHFTGAGEAQKVKNCFWELREQGVLASTTDYEEKEEYSIRDKTGKIKQLHRRSNTTLYSLDDEFEFNIEFDDGVVATYSKQQINSLARVIISMMFFNYWKEDDELGITVIVNDIIACEAARSMPKK